MFRLIFWLIMMDFVSLFVQGIQIKNDQNQEKNITRLKKRNVLITKENFFLYYIDTACIS